MRRVMLLAAAMAFALAMVSGAALADNIEGDGGNDRLVGTNGKDTISGAGGNDDIFGKGGSDRLFGDSGNDDVYGGGGRYDRLQGGLGRDELFGQEGFDIANALDGQANDRVNCGRGFDVAAIDDFEIAFQDPGAPADQVSQNCEVLYVGVVIGNQAAASSVDLSAIDTREEAEAAEADGLLKQIR